MSQQSGPKKEKRVTDLSQKLFRGESTLKYRKSDETHYLRAYEIKGLDSDIHN